MFVFGVHHQHTYAKSLAEAESTVYRVAQQQPPVALTLVLGGNSQPSNASGGYRVSRQPLAIGRLQIVRVELSGSETQVTEDAG